MFHIKNYEAKRDASPQRAKTVLVDGKAACQKKTRDEETDSIIWVTMGAPMATSNPIQDEKQMLQSRKQMLQNELATVNGQLADLTAQIADVKTILGE